MAKYCPISKTKVLYLECLECDEQVCRNIDASQEQPDIPPKEQDNNS